MYTRDVTNQYKQIIERSEKPTYRFSVGDKVKLDDYGEPTIAVVKDVLEDGRFYEVELVSDKTGNPIIIQRPWVDVRPICDNSTSFTQNKDIEFYQNSFNVRWLIHLFYHQGIDLDPAYQRGYVWSDYDRELLIDSIFTGVDIGKLVFVIQEEQEEDEKGVLYEVLDGKQRIRTIVDFYENRFSCKGKYYNDLSLEDRLTFNDYQLSWADLRTRDEEVILRAFLMLNRTGKVMDSQHLAGIESQLKKLQESKVKSLHNDEEA